MLARAKAKAGDLPITRVETLLDHAGFTIPRRFGGPDCSPLTAESWFMVYMCEIKDS
jgi:hypothetical protein